MIRLQAEQHPCVSVFNSDSPLEYAQHQMKIYAYTIAAQLAKNKTVLDVGCNDGYGTHLLSVISSKTIGIDVSEKAIHKAIAQYGNPKIDFYVADGAQLPFDANQFDIIVSFQVIEHIVDCHKYLSEIKRTLKAGGIAFFTTPNAAIRLDPGMKPWNPFHVREYNHSELKGQLNPFFSNVDIRALFAKGEFYSTIINHMAHARENARRQQQKIHQSYLWKLFKKGIPKFVFHKWETLRNKHKEDSSHNINTKDHLSDYKNKFKLEHLTYRTDNLDAGMNLMAICTDDINMLNEVSRFFCL